MNNKQLLNICYKYFNEFINDLELIDQLENINKDELTKKDIEEINKLIDSIKNISNNSDDKWFDITKIISNNDYFNKCYDSLSDYELLEFIAQNISAPYPPKLNQEEFDKLVKVGIEKDEREWLWRLAFNYVDKNINFDLIVDYYIKVKDGYYLSELISAVGESLDIDLLIDKITDKELIEDLIKRKDSYSIHFTDEQFDKLINKKNT